MNFRAILFSFLVVTACAEGKVDTSKIQEEMKAREIKVIPEAQIIEQTMILGDSIVNTFEVTRALQTAGKTMKTWNDIDPKMTCTAYLLEATYTMQEKEAGIFEAYKYSAANGQTADPNVQRLPDDIMVYNAPLEVEGQVRGMWSVHLPRKYIILSLD